jgi:hypothetical protein
MTIEATREPLRGGDCCRYGAIALAAWSVLLAGVTVVAEPTPEVVIVGPAARALAALRGTDTRILDMGESYVRVRGMEPGFVRALYANGAWLVLPGRAGGCRSYQKDLT